MRKITHAILFGLITSTISFAQSFDDGTNLFSIGFGIPPAQRIKNELNEQYKANFEYKLNNYGTLVLKYEHGLIKYFGMGLNLEYSGAGVSYKYYDKLQQPFQQKVKSNVFGFYARFNGHYPITDKFDLYGGVGLGYQYSINKYTDTNPNPDTNISKKIKIFDFDYQATIGARFMIKENFGMFAELGRATTTAQVGFTFKF
jgi:opacity protein-like surface antigen